ncbi:hypothetical protein LG198_05505 [Methylobacillus arboreus]|uniref:hypothetical protein n=1 Tax=Methylobacillus arboreus TaxID=755170 RepID=UPI001E4083F4|nr:hypothetical protein [Methylobacillus arboreus]MCB5190179.1 hypothetical protein [Methylobacillus arboreus]
MIEALLVDLDDTLLDDRSALRAALNAFFQAHCALLAGESLESSLVRWRNISARHWQKYERGEISFDDQRRARVREFLNKQFNDADADQAFKPYLDTYEASWKLAPHCTEFLQKTAHFPKIIITKWGAFSAT